MKISNLKFQINKKGFTLIELLVVMSIIAILVASATASWRNAQMKGRDGKRKSDFKAVQQALENYYQVNGKYPDYDSATGKIKCNVGVATIFDWGGAASFNCNSITFMQQLPKDPVYQTDAGKNYFYSSSSPNVSYVISVDLENDSDPDRVSGGVPCTPQGTRDYCVTSP